MKPTTIWIDGPLPGLNEIISAAKSGRGKRNAYYRVKGKWTHHIAMLLRSKRVPQYKSVFLIFEWVEEHKRRDPDNIAAGGRKIILDAMVKAGVIKDDGWKQICGWKDGFETSHRSGVWLKIEEV